MATEQIIQTRNKPHRRMVKHLDAPNCVRCYRESPESVHLQLRRTGDIVGISLTFTECEQLAAMLVAAARS